MAATAATATVASLAARVAPVDRTAVAAARERHRALATPPHALGRVAALGCRLAGIAGACPPPVVARPTLLIAAADHGVHARDVSPWPQSVTAAMVRAFCAGSSTASVFAEAVGAEVHVLDVGLAEPVAPHPRLRRAAPRRGTRDLAAGPAMTPTDCAAAVRAGASLAEERIADGADLLLAGDMGIANTTAAAALISAFTGADPAAVTGRGTGIDDETLARKRAAVATAVARHRSDDALATLAGLGGLEHAALVGALLAAAGARVPVLLDGVNAGAAAVAASALASPLAGHLLAGHRSTEPGATRALEHLGLRPLLDLELRLGEGTGALLAVPVVRAAAAALRDVATLDDVVGG